MIKKSSLWLVSLLTLGSASAFAADGDPDSTFGFSARAYIPWVRGTPDAADTVAVLSQPDGKVVLVGNVNVYSGFNDQDGNPINTNGIGVTRELLNGQMDPSFGGNGTGYFLIYSDPRDDHVIHARAATLDINGRILIAGYDSDHNVGRQSAAVWAVKPTGSALDANFGSGGEYVHDRGVNGSSDTLLSIYASNATDIQTGTWNGYLVSGIVNNNDGINQGYVSGLTATGHYFAEYAFPISANGATCATTTAASLAFKTGGLAGSLLYASGTAVCGGLHFAHVVRIRNWGPDLTFAGTGVKVFSFGGNGSDPVNSPSAATSVAIDIFGRALVGGYVYSSDLRTPKDMGVARIGVGGDFDTSFAGNGYTTFSWGSAEYTWVNKVLLQYDGKILLGGNEVLMLPGAPPAGLAALMRLNDDGSADSGFGNRFGVSGASDYNFPLHGGYSPMPLVSSMDFTEGENVLLGGYVQDPTALQSTYFSVMRIRNGPIRTPDLIFRDGFE
ncbi:hypothetical protein [Dokdonella soli]|uniref:Delta-60 repeat domain-containing protein n=1 Tax=Dokdonella soli TaxID=529810 RepID=A0ABN1IDX4_9GAMM